MWHLGRQARRPADYLPEFPAIEPGLRLGRNVRDGYARGWGLQFGKLRNDVRADPIYRRALRPVRRRSLVTPDCRMNLFLICRFFLGRLEPGHIVEFGAYKGANAAFLARVAKELHPGTRVYALDTFTGIPAADSSIDAHVATDFGDVDLARLRADAARGGLDNLEFVQGRFEDTAPALLERIGKVALAHVDSDTYASVAFAYDAVRPHLVPGGYLVSTTPTVSSCLGATDAVEALVIRRDGILRTALAHSCQAP